MAINYLTQNSKIKAMSGPKTYNWGIPAFMSQSGLRTCPKAGICAKGCYAKQGAYIWSNVVPAFERRLELSQRSDFAEVLTKEIKRRKIERVRIHDSGDFYDLKYLSKWLTIIKENPTVKFYAYTKMVEMFKKIENLPNNFTVIYSFGGKDDHLIDTSQDRHSKVFDSADDLNKHNYIDASKNDANALTDNIRVGLIYHGAKSKKWTID